MEWGSKVQKYKPPGSNITAEVCLWDVVSACSEIYEACGSALPLAGHACAWTVCLRSAYSSHQDTYLYVVSLAFPLAAPQPHRLRMTLCMPFAAHQAVFTCCCGCAFPPRLPPAVC